MLAIEVRKSGQQATAIVKGNIDEAAGKGFLEAMPKLMGLDVVFDCAGINAINSVGFRSWLQFLHGLKGKTTFTFVECPPVYMEYAGMLSTTAFAQLITSVQVPFRCSTCRKEESTTFEVDDLSTTEDLEDRVCPGCNGLMQAAVQPSELLSYKDVGDG